MTPNVPARQNQETLKGGVLGYSRAVRNIKLFHLEHTIPLKSETLRGTSPFGYYCYVCNHLIKPGERPLKWVVRRESRLKPLWAQQAFCLCYVCFMEYQERYEIELLAARLAGEF